MKIIKPGPNKGSAIEIDSIAFMQGLENNYEKQQIFKKQRPKSAIHDKFARPSSGVHSIYKKMRG